MTFEQVVTVICGAASLLGTITMGVLAFFIKRTLTQLEGADKKNASDIKDLEKQLNGLKSDLPLVYVLREDFIRAMNGVDHKLGQIITIVSNKNGG